MNKNNKVERMKKMAKSRKTTLSKKQNSIEIRKDRILAKKGKG